MINSDFRRLELIEKFSQTNGYFPTHKQMLALFGVRSKNATHKWTERMILEGILRKDGSRLYLVDNRLRNAVVEAIEAISKKEVQISANASRILNDFIKC
jgi:hypothetical protein